MNRILKASLPLLASVPPGFALATIGATNGKYGFWLFLGVPVLMGFLAVLVDTRDEPKRLGRCMAMAMLPLGISSLLLLLWKIEGIICLIMAAPLAIPLSLFGGYLAWQVRGGRKQTLVSSCLVALIPFGVLMSPTGPGTKEFRVSTSIVVNAPPEVVWNYVTAFPDLRPPDEFIFRAGVAAPMGTALDGEGVGAGRECILSTGVMRERVSVWDPPRLLRFEVLSTPPAMKELSLYSDLDPPHLHGFYVSKSGEFALKALAGNRTLVTGTSVYRHGLEPAQYWRLWSDYVIHKVHRRVLEHVKQLSEEELPLKLEVDKRDLLVAGR